MKPIVVDASLLGAAFFAEPHSERAASLLASKRPLLAPDLIVAEFANVVWKRIGRGEIDRREADQMLGDFTALPLRLTAGSELIAAAFEIAVAFRRTVYDALYLALAVEQSAVLVTADRRLVNAMASSPLAPHVAALAEADRIE